MIVTQFVFSVQAHGMGRISCFILKFITTCTEGKAVVLAVPSFSCQVHTALSMEANSITAVPLTTDSKNRFHICRSHFFAVPFKKKKKKKVKSTHHMTCSFQFFRSLNERTVKLRFSKCPRACLCLRNKYFLR